MSWRYQPVIVLDHGGDFCTLCEVYFDDADRLIRWGQPMPSASGEDVSQLQSDLVRMLVDSYSWVPVQYDDLRVGMTFERALTMEERENIARMVEFMRTVAGKVRELPK